MNLVPPAAADRLPFGCLRRPSFSQGQLATGRRLLEGSRVCTGLRRRRFPCTGRVACDPIERKVLSAGR
jgi:hypothetical protein